MKNFYMIGHLEVPQRMILNKPLWYFDTNNKEGIATLFEELRELTNYEYGNTHLQWSNLFGHMFAIAIHYSKYSGQSAKWVVNLWDHSGATAVYSFSEKVKNKEEDVLPQNRYDEMQKITQAFVRGRILCSGCKKEISKDDIAGSYFAGRYCEDCWESRFKAIEAKETYN